ncbi:MAG TPA: hypothetical protein VJT67_03750, partial [Longimicrobiaceae bacterium]|nr:hypothetical protein [Longimicrobiaceae bacterium]
MLPDRFRRQFLAAPRPAAAFAAWRRVEIGGLHVHAHPDLGLACAGGDGEGVRVVLLGFAIDPDHPELDDAAIAARIAAGRTLEDAITAAVDLAGRWVLLVEAEGGLYALNDACGLRTVHYTVAEDGPYLASNPALLGTMLPLRPNAIAAEYLDSEYRRRTLEHWLPSGTTLFEGVGHLVPNHYLRVAAGEQVRYWPTRPLPSHPMRESVPRSAALLRRLLAAGAARFPLALPITSGWDSRILLGASRPLAGDLFAYTLVYRALNDASPDVRIPREMLRATGITHHTIECTAPAPEAFLEVYRKSVDLPHDDWARIAWGMHRGYPRERVCLKGNCAEIARNSYFSNVRADPTPRAIADQEFGGLPFAVEALERWIGPAREVCAAVGMEVLDLLYMEHLMGSWQARSQLEWDLVQEAYTPYNHRPLIVEMLGVPQRDRDKPAVRMWHALLRELWPELARWPVNPRPPIQRMRLAAHHLLDRMGVLPPLRRAYRRGRALL